MNALTLDAAFFVLEKFHHFWTKKLGQFCIYKVNSTNFANFVVKFAKIQYQKNEKKKTHFMCHFWWNIRYTRVCRE